MTLNLALSTETEDRLRRKAAQQGEDVASYLKRLAERDAQDERAALSDEEFEALLDELSEGSKNWPVLAPGAFERASF